jgi:hypothetical protein
MSTTPHYTGLTRDMIEESKRRTEQARIERERRNAAELEAFHRTQHLPPAPREPSGLKAVPNLTSAMRQCLTAPNPRAAVEDLIRVLSDK